MLNDESYETLIYLFIQHLYSALFTNKPALMRYLTNRILTEIKCKNLNSLHSIEKKRNNFNL